MLATLPWAEGENSPGEIWECPVLNGTKAGGKVKTTSLFVKTKAMNVKTKALFIKTKALFYVFLKNTKKTMK